MSNIVDDVVVDYFRIQRLTMSTGSTTEAPNSGGGGAGSSDQNEDNDGSVYECNICLDTAHDPVVSMCGHLFWYVNFKFNQNEPKVWLDISSY